jgi:hypothetical protein
LGTICFRLYITDDTHLWRSSLKSRS